MLKIPCMQALRNAGPPRLQVISCLAWIYLPVSLFLAILFFHYNPPMAYGHEWQHFLRGMTLSPLYQDGTLPRSIISFAHGVKRKHNYKKLEKKFGELALDSGNRVEFISYNNVARYPFTAYSAHIIAGTAGHALNLRPLSIYYLVEVLLLSAWVIGGFLILRMLPAYHLPFFILLVMPTTWKMCMIQYPDSTLNLAVLLYFAMVIRHAYGKGPLTWKAFVGYGLCGLTISTVKLVYLPLVAAILLVPASRFRSLAQQAVFIVTLFAICAAGAALSMKSAYRNNYAVNIADLTAAAWTGDESYKEKFAQMAGLPRGKHAQGERTDSARYQNKTVRVLTDPAGVIRKVVLFYSHSGFWLGLHSSAFAWAMPQPQRVPKELYLFLLLPFVFAVTLREKQLSGMRGCWPKLWQRLLLILIVSVTMLLIGLALYVNDSPYDRRIVGLTGRYLLPCALPLMLACTVPVPKRWYRPFLGVMIVGVAFVLVLYYSALFS